MILEKLSYATLRNFMRHVLGKSPAIPTPSGTPQPLYTAKTLYASCTFCIRARHSCATELEQMRPREHMAQTWVRAGGGVGG